MVNDPCFSVSSDPEALALLHNRVARVGFSFRSAARLVPTTAIPWAMALEGGLLKAPSEEFRAPAALLRLLLRCRHYLE